MVNNKFMNQRIILVCAILILILFSDCSQNRDVSSNKIVEKLESQIKSENYEQIYSESSRVVRSHISKEEFFEKMNTAVGRMKNIDESMCFEKDESRNLQNGDVYRDLHFVYRKIEKSGKKLNVFVTFDFSSSKPEFFDLCIDNSIPTEEKNTMCITDAIKEL